MSANPLVQILEKHPGKKAVIFGAGAGGQTVFYTWRNAGGEVAYFVDNRRAGGTFCGLPVVSPYDLLCEESDRLLVIVGACRDGDAEEMQKQLEGMGFSKGVHFEMSQLGGLYAPLDHIDPHLGYNRMGELMGFKVFGNIETATKKIVVLGGSTSDYSFGGFKSWPQFLQEILGRASTSTVVLNGAVAGYTTGQSLLKLVRDVVPLRPDVVISFEGVNDAVQERVAGHPLVHPYAFSTFETMFQATPKEGLSINQTLSGITFGVKDAAGRVESWMRNLRAMQALCREFGIRFFAFLQPTVFSGSPDSAGDPQSDAIRTFYREARECAAAFESVIDASGLLDGIENAYFDFVHYSESGNAVIAEWVHRAIAGEGTKSSTGQTQTVQHRK